MQTFLTTKNFIENAKVLDRQRLGKQRVEAYQILNTLINGGGWKNHPCIKQWSGYEWALTEYGLAICGEWISRGYKDTMYGRILNLYKSRFHTDYFLMPDWLNEEKLYSSHRAALLYKNYDWYKRFSWKEEPRIDYWWPKRN